MPVPYYGAHPGDVVDAAIARVVGSYEDPADARAYLELGDAALEDVGVPGGVCPLDSNAKVPLEHLPETSGATESDVGGILLNNDLGGTAEEPEVVGLQSDDLPSKVANGFLKRNSSNNAWEQVAYGNSANTVCQGNDGRLDRYRTLWVGAGSMIPRTTDGAEAGSAETATNKIMSDTLDFDGTTQEFAQVAVAMPDEWDRSTVKVKVFWMPATGASAADTVEWGLKAGAYSNDDALDAALGSEVTVGDAVIAVGDVHVTAASGAVTVGGSPALGDLIVFQVSRNPAGTDDMAEDALLLGIMIQYKESGAAAQW